MSTVADPASIGRAGDDHEDDDEDSETTAEKVGS
jgi:hypothetical protein